MWIRKQVRLNGDVLCLNRTLLVQFFREICPFKERTPKYNVASGTIAGTLLIINFLVLEQGVVNIHRLKSCDSTKSNRTGAYFPQSMLQRSPRNFQSCEIHRNLFRSTWILELKNQFCYCILQQLASQRGKPLKCDHGAMVNFTS
jgi:hypothetical protein